MSHCGIKRWDKSIENKVCAANAEKYERMGANLDLCY